MTALWMPVNDVAGEQATIAAAKRWQSRLFTSSGTWTVPADVGVIWIDGCGGGAGGGGGFASATSGGGGGGGASAPSFVQHHMPVTAGETLTLTVGAGGPGAAVGAGSSGVTETRIVGGVRAVTTGTPGGGGVAGTATNGGNAVGYGSSAVVGGTGAGGGNTTLFISTSTTANHGYAPRYAGNTDAVWQSGCAGGGPGYAGGLSICGPRMGLGQTYISGGTPTGSAGNGLGGGGSGGNGLYGTCGAGGAGGAAGENATGYGAGGGGGGGNAPGGDGSPGFIRIYCFSATTI